MYVSTSVFRPSLHAKFGGDDNFAVKQLAQSANVHLVSKHKRSHH